MKYPFMIQTEHQKHLQLYKTWSNEQNPNFLQ